MVAMLEYCSKLIMHHDSGHGHLNRGMPGSASATAGYMVQRRRDGGFRYNGNLSGAKNNSWYTRWNSYPGVSRGASRYQSSVVIKRVTGYSSGGGGNYQLAVGTERWGYTFIRRRVGVVNSKYNRKTNNYGHITSWGEALGGNIKGRIATLKWRGDILWKP